MKCLILSITTGQGHNQTAKVISDYLKEHGAECSYMDVFNYINPALSGSISRLYLMSTKSLPRIYGGVYRMAERRRVGEGMHGISKLTNTVLARPLIKYIKTEKPDVIICTHIFAGLLVTYIAERYGISAKTVGIVTDFTFHPYWEDSALDYYVIANPLLMNQGMKKGIPKEKFVCTGIPIDLKFSKKTPRDEACRKLGIDNTRTILVMGGSMGFGHISGMIKELDNMELNFQIVSVCGNNKKLKEKIDKTTFKKKVINYGFTDKVDLLMDAADCIITKPGGLTTSEALAKGLPIIMANPIPGQEDRNVEFLLNAGAALKISNTYPIDNAVYQIFSSQKRREHLRTTAADIGKPNATEDLANFLNSIK